MKNSEVKLLIKQEGNVFVSSSFIEIKKGVEQSSFTIASIKKEGEQLVSNNYQGIKQEPIETVKKTHWNAIQFATVACGIVAAIALPITIISLNQPQAYCDATVKVEATDGNVTSNYRIDVIDEKVQLNSFTPSSDAASFLLAGLESYDLPSEMPLGNFLFTMEMLANESNLFASEVTTKTSSLFKDIKAKDFLDKEFNLSNIEHIAQPMPTGSDLAFMQNALRVSDNFERLYRDSEFFNKDQFSFEELMYGDKNKKEDLENINTMLTRLSLTLPTQDDIKVLDHEMDETGPRFEDFSIHDFANQLQEHIGEETKNQLDANEEYWKQKEQENKEYWKSRWDNKLPPKRKK